MLGWYLFRTKARCELQAEEHLKCLGYQVFLPTLPTEVDADQPSKPAALFPGYLFIRFDPFQSSIRKILTLSTMSQIVRTCGEVQPVELALVRALRKRCATTCNIPTKSTFCAGDKVTIKDGPFTQVDAIFHETVGSKRCKLLLDMLGKVQIIETDLNNLAVGDRLAV